MRSMALDALIFDIDGTLIDSNPAHVEAWRIAFERHGYPIAPDRIEFKIGKGGDKLVPDILGREADEKDGDALRKAEPEEFAKIGRARGFHAFPRALDLLATARQRGLKIILATSSQKKQLATLQEYSGVDLEGACDVIITADDAEESKPAPDIVTAAVRKAKLSPAQCALVGDTLYDMQSAKHAGVIGLGVLTGYQSAATLKQAGAPVVYNDVAEMLDNLHEVLHRDSPTAVHPPDAPLGNLVRQAVTPARGGAENAQA